MKEWHDLESYVSDLNSLLDLDIEVGDGLIRIGLGGAWIMVLKKDVGWAITYESSEGVSIRVEGGVAVRVFNLVSRDASLRCGGLGASRAYIGSRPRLGHDGARVL